MVDEGERARRLLHAQALADELFDVIASELLRPGRSELELSRLIKQEAQERLGVTQHWHKRIVRAGPNTLHPYRENPADRVIGDDDIVFVDLGPVFAEWEADVGRTFVLGDDPAKHAVRDALEPCWEAGRAWFEARPDATGAELYAAMGELAQAAGYAFGGDIAGHLVGEFPHERIADGWDCYVAPQNTTPMRGLDPKGRQRHWILEVHLIDVEAGFGGFHERLLTLP
jgi:Xaa-Pro aminopeptidase